MEEYGAVDINHKMKGWKQQAEHLQLLHKVTCCFTAVQSAT